VRRLDDLIGDFADTAALLKQLDALVCVDTAVAHLAGTLGLPTILLLPHCPDWRWGAMGESTSWYPSMRLVRQTRAGVWDDALSRAKELLERGF
jgi:ADP-heptose:LPS heptosyltransferase